MQYYDYEFIIILHEWHLFNYTSSGDKFKKIIWSASYIRNKRYMELKLRKNCGITNESFNYTTAVIHLLYLIGVVTGNQ